MKKFTINCDFGGQKSPFTVYIGDPEPTHHPLHFQADWLSKERGGTIPGDVMDSIAKLYDLAKKNNVSFEELCVYALSASNDDEEDNSKPQNKTQQEQIPHHQEAPTSNSESYDNEEKSPLPKSKKKKKKKRRRNTIDDNSYDED